MLKGWRTIGFAALVALVGVAQQADLATIVPPKYLGLALLLIGLANAGLRSITTTPLGKPVG